MRASPGGWSATAKARRSTRRCWPTITPPRSSRRTSIWPGRAANGRPKSCAPRPSGGRGRPRNWPSAATRSTRALPCCAGRSASKPSHGSRPRSGSGSARPAPSGLTPHHRLHAVGWQILLESVTGRWDEVRGHAAEAERVVDANLAAATLTLAGCQIGALTQSPVPGGGCLPAVLARGSPWPRTRRGPGPGARVLHGCCRASARSRRR